MSLLDYSYVYYPKPRQDRSLGSVQWMPFDDVWFQVADGRGCSSGTLRRRQIVRSQLN